MARLASLAISLGQTGVFTGVFLLNELHWIRQNEHYKVEKNKGSAFISISWSHHQTSSDGESFLLPNIVSINHTTLRNTQFYIKVYVLLCKSLVDAKIDVTISGQTKVGKHIRTVLTNDKLLVH